MSELLERWLYASSPPEFSPVAVTDVLSELANATGSSCSCYLPTDDRDVLRCKDVALEAIVLE